MYFIIHTYVNFLIENVIYLTNSNISIIFFFNSYLTIHNCNLQFRDNLYVHER
jgi:hypothetical protein